MIGSKPPSLLSCVHDAVSWHQEPAKTVMKISIPRPSSVLAVGHWMTEEGILVTRLLEALRHEDDTLHFLYWTLKCEFVRSGKEMKLKNEVMPSAFCRSSGTIRLEVSSLKKETLLPGGTIRHHIGNGNSELWRHELSHVRDTCGTRAGHGSYLESWKSIKVELA